jgi:hypothetical protein
MVVMSSRSFVCLLALIPLVCSLSPTSLAFLSPDTGYSFRTVYDTLGTFTIMEALDARDGVATVNAGTNIMAVTVSNAAAVSYGTLPPNATVAYLKWRDNTLHVAYGVSFSFPFPSRYGIVESGTYVNHGASDGVYDAATASDGTLYLMANPGAAGSRVFRFVPATTSLVEVASIGGFSGPIAIDSSNNLYVGEQSFGDEKILRFTPGQLAAGNLTAADGEVVVITGSTYMCLDENDRLYVTSGYGNFLNVYDVWQKQLVRAVAVDAANGYGIGRIVWDRINKKLIAIHTDFGAYDSTLNALGYADMYEGTPGTATVFQGWVAGYQSFVRSDTNSGGYARDNDGNPASVWSSVVGRPAEFDPEIFPIGHVLSLGNGGSIVLELDDVMANKSGPDFAVFENGFEFNGIFAELAFVEVGTTTNAWARFPVTSFITNALAAFGTLDATRVDGVAGKHTIEFGTPFELDWLKNDTNVLSGAVNLNQIAYIRLADVVGGSSVDQFGKPIHDSYAIGNASADGFDLRGVGIFHLAGTRMEPEENGVSLVWYGYANRPYQPQSSDGVTWTNHGTSIVGTGGWHRISLPAGTGTTLWRVEQTISPVP